MTARVHSAQSSPVKAASFQRGTSRVAPLASPKGSMRLRSSLSGHKFLAAQQQSRKASNPIKLGTAEDEEWLDEPETKSTMPIPAAWPDLKPPEPNVSEPVGNTSSNNLGDPAGTSGGPPIPASDSNSRAAAAASGQQLPAQPKTPPQAASPVDSRGDSPGTLSRSFAHLSPSGASFFRLWGRRRAHKPLYDDRGESTFSFDSQSFAFDTSSQSTYGMPPAGYREQRDTHSRGYSGGSAGHSSGRARSSGSHSAHNPRDSGAAYTAPAYASRPSWMDPAMPGLIALYLQVSFNLLMVCAVLYAIGVFYCTIRNDVNLKVEEYSVDIVDQISKCSFEYLRNGCEPGKRVPAIEAACQQWERCMQRDPKEVGRAKVSAETFGTIIDAFIQPIGLKSMLFIFVMFAGSFLLVNAVFSSRIGPRFNSSHFDHPQMAPQMAPQMGQPMGQPMSQPMGQPLAPLQNIPASPMYEQQYIMPRSSNAYTPGGASPRYRHAQSSPHRTPYRL